ESCARPSAASRPSAGQSGSQPAAVAGWRSAPDGVTDRSGPKAPVLFVAIEYLVASLTGYPEIPADVRHGLPVQQAGDKAKALFHHRTRFPRHPHLPPQRRKVLPMCPVRNVTYVSGRSEFIVHLWSARRCDIRSG